MRKLRILFVSEYFYPRPAGGEVWAWELCKELAKRGHEVTVLTSRHDALSKEETIDDVKIFRPVKTTSDVNKRWLRCGNIKRLVEHVRDYVNEHEASIDIIHTMAYGVNVEVSKIARSHKIPCVTSIHSFFSSYWRALVPDESILKWLELRKLKKDKSLVMHVPSEYLHGEILRKAGKTTQVIHNWLPDRIPKPKKLPAKTVLFIGSLEKIKNPEAVIQVAENLKAKKMIIIGKGSLEGKLKKKASKIGLNSQFIQYASHEETLKYIGGASLVLIPSHTESFSLVALEAVAQGTPISGNRVGILPELPGFTQFPPTAFPPRIPIKKQHQVRKDFAKKRIVAEFEKLYHNLKEGVLIE